MLVPPYNFVAVKEGYKRIGTTARIRQGHAADLHDGLHAVGAEEPPQLVKGMITAVNKSIDWFYDTKNREEAIKFLMATAFFSKANRDEVAESDDFLIKIQHFAKDRRDPPRAPFEALIKDMRDLKFVLDRRQNPSRKDRLSGHQDYE